MIEFGFQEALVRPGPVNSGIDTVQQRRHFRIFIASPGDVAEERGIARRLIDELRYDPALRDTVSTEAVAWDLWGPVLKADRTPQQTIVDDLTRPSDCDIVLVILWSQIGSALPTTWNREDGSRRSGTEWEFDDALESNRVRGYPAIWVFRRTDPAPWTTNDNDLDEKIAQLQGLRAFFDRFSDDEGAAAGGFNEYSIESFQEHLERHLRRALVEALRQPIEPAGTKPSAREGRSTPAWNGSPFPGLLP